jgi:predicted nucleotidyltransferase
MNTHIATVGPARLLLGKARLAILALLFGRPEERFYLRQIARASGYGLGPVQRELKLLTEAGILRRTAQGRQVYFQADPESPIFSDLRSLLTKTVGIGGTLRDALTPLAAGIKAAFIYGSVARGEERAGSDIDLLVVGEATFAEVVTALQAAQQALGREINPTVYPADEFRAKIEAKHHFLSSVLEGPKIFLMGDDHELAGMA